MNRKNNLRWTTALFVCGMLATHVFAAGANDRVGIGVLALHLNEETSPEGPCGFESVPSVKPPALPEVADYENNRPEEQIFCVRIKKSPVAPVQ